MKPWAIAGLIIAVLVLIGGAAYLGTRTSQQASQRQTTEAPPTVSVTRGTVQQTITAPGQVTGTREAILGLPVSGQLAEIVVRPGSTVKAGDILAQVVEQPFVEALAEARLKLSQAEAELAYDLAQAQLDRQIIETELSQAQAKTSNRAAAKASLTAAQANLRQQLKPPDEDRLTIAGADLRRAELALAQAQGAYDAIAYGDAVGASPEAQQLQEATIVYQTALAEYNLAIQGVDEADIANAQARVEQAESELNQLQFEEWANQQAVVALQAQLAQMALNIERLEAGVDPFLERQVAQAEKDLTDATLVAPFDGVVLEVLRQPGEQVEPGMGVIILADPAAIEIETTVIEEDLPFVEIGQPVELFFDAAPAEAVPGVVTRIVPKRVPNKDRPLYYVYMTPEVPPASIVSGMTADASIIVAKAEEVLRLPRALVRAGSSDTARVLLWQAGQEVEQSIRVGMRGDIYIEIVDGLSEGEAIVGE